MKFFHKMRSVRKGLITLVRSRQGKVSIVIQGKLKEGIVIQGKLREGLLATLRSCRRVFLPQGLHWRGFLFLPLMRI